MKKIITIALLIFIRTTQTFTMENFSQAELDAEAEYVTT